MRPLTRTPGTSACPRLRAWTGWTALALTLAWGPAARLLHVVEKQDAAEGATHTVALLWSAPAALETTDTTTTAPDVQPLVQNDAHTPAAPQIRQLADDTAASRADGEAPAFAGLAPHQAGAPWLAHAPPDGCCETSTVLSGRAARCAARPRAPPAS